MTKPHDGTIADMEREIRELRAQAARLARALAAGPAALRDARPDRCRPDYLAWLVESAQQRAMEEE